jgi:YYY domain-containing protein
MAGALTAVVLMSTLAWAWGFTSIYRRDNTRVQASRWIYQNVPAPLNLRLSTSDGAYIEPLPLPEGVQLNAEAPYRVQFQARVTGVASEFTVAHARHAFDPASPGVLRVVLAADPDGQQVLARSEVRVEPVTGDLRGQAYRLPLGPAAIQEGETYYVLVAAPEGGPLSLSGSVVSNENWDEGLPLRLDGRDAFGGLYRGLTMEVRWQDDENKRQMFLTNLAQVDYIILPSQRGLWSASRLPNTYPMTMEYYRALFDGRLGFDLVAQFQSPIVVGPLQVSDLVGTVAWGRPPAVPAPGEDFPFNDSLLAAEEAFSVYDHAPVWIFEKRPDFNLDRAAQVLYAVDLSQVVVQGPREATRAPTLMMLPADRLAEQRAGGTWREMFDPEGLLNRYQPLGVLAWYLSLLVVGWLAFPLTFAAFGGLPDRGYPLAKTVALLVVAWFVWVLGSFGVLPFTRLTVALGFLALAVISGLIFWLRRVEIGDYVRAQRRHLLVVEVVTLALFAFDLLIRLGNPDLWHPFFGGEKPMVFSFFNAVLKSTSFPPYDPWLAGGYINYYYYGFVVVGLLVKLLGIIPAIAYNLILPTLFALLGVNAFCAAYNLVKAQGARRKGQGENPNPHAIAADPPGVAVETAAVERTVESPAVSALRQDAAPSSVVGRRSSVLRPPSPYLAGLAAALLVVVLGNLGQVWFLMEAFQKAADHPALEASVFGDNEVTATLNGAWRVMLGHTTLPVGLGSWYWDATRIVATIISQQNEGRHGGEINEFPFFTFLYADLHAHMMDMPLAMLALAWAAAYVLGRRREHPRLEAAAMWFLGGLALGVTRATNTWDFPTYLAIGVVAVVAAEWLRDPRLTRDHVFAIAWRLALLVGLAFLLYQPFDRWFASPISKADFWRGEKTPLEPYLYIHGLFLFILVTFLVWETRRWLAETPAAVLAQAGEWLPVVVLALTAFAVAVGVFLYLEVVVAVVALPLMAWAGLLLLRARSALSMAKRAALFLLGTGLALTLFTDVYAIGGDRMNTIFKLYIQVWLLFSVAAGAALAWVWAELPAWAPAWRAAWTTGLTVLVASAALYTVTATNAKIKDRFPARAVDPNIGCAQIPGMPIPYEGNQSLPVPDQPRSLNGMDYMTWSAYCDRTYFLPLAYDHDAIRWMQDNVEGSPVVAEAQSFDLYRMSSRYAWNTGLPNVVGWDWHQRQERGAAPTEFITQRGREVTEFYTDPDPGLALAFLKKYDVRYIVVGPMERAYYPPEGLAKFDTLAALGQLAVVYPDAAHPNPGVTIYQVQTIASR